MAEVSSELIHEVLKGIQQDVRLVKDAQGDHRQEPISIRLHLVSIGQDINNIYGILGRHDQRLDRIERRLDLRELAEPQKPFDPAS
jgi:hypothetical protein